MTNSPVITRNGDEFLTVTEGEVAGEFGRIQVTFNSSFSSAISARSEYRTPQVLVYTAAALG